MDSAGFVKFASQIISKDWKRHWKPMIATVTGMALGVLFVMRFGPDPAMAKGIIIGAGVVCPYGFSQLCFFIERQHGLLKQLLIPSTTPTQLVLAKYGSAFSMAVFVVTVPGILLRDLAFLCYMNIGVLFMTSICMAIAVLSDIPWATMLPVWIVLFPYLYTRRSLDNLFRWVIPHSTAISIAGVCLIPMIIYVSAVRFQMDPVRNDEND